MGQTERDLLGAGHRRAETEGHRTRRDSDQVQDLEEAVNLDGEIPEDEMPHEDTGITQAISESPELMLLWRKLAHEKQRRANQITKAMGAKPPAEVMSKLEKTIRNLRALIIAVAIPAGSSVILVGKYLYAKGAEDERAQFERSRQAEQLDEVTKIARDAINLSTRNAQRLDDSQFERSRHPDARDEDHPSRKSP